MNTRRTALVASSLASAAALMLTGCATNPSRTSIQAIRHHPTPELASIAKTPDMLHNDTAITYNQMFRGLKQDLKHLVWYNDRPTRLVPEPVSY